MAEKDTIILIRSSAIGDVVLASACLDYIYRLEVDFNIVWIGSEPSLSLIKSHPCVKEVFSVTDNELLERINVYSSRVLAVMDLQANLRSIRLSNKISSLVGAPVTRWNKNSLERSKLVFRSRILGRSRPLFQKSYTLKYRSMLNCFVSALGIEYLDSKILEDATPSLSVNLSSGVRILSHENEWIGICPGASFQTKKMPLVHWNSVFAILSKLKPGIKVAIFGAKTDIKDAMELENILSSYDIDFINFSGKLTLPESAEYLSKMKLYMGNDSGLGHIAEAVGVDCYTFFGPTVEQFGFSPWRKNSRVYSSNIGCRPCSKHGKTPCRFNDMKCFSTINFSNLERDFSDFFEI